MRMLTSAICADGVRKRFGEVDALDGLDLEVPAGTVCGLLGPNGAGKTTAVGVLSTLTRPDAGTVQVAGLNALAEPAQVRRRIGLVGQHAAVDEVLGGRENLEIFGRLFHLSRRDARARAGELLAQFGLGDVDDRPVAKYSGGMRRRLDLAAAMILAPQVLFLDEPTTGLDPRGRFEVWEAVRALVASGTSVLLTTQYLEEADELASSIVVIAAGRAIATGTPAELKARVAGDRIEVVLVHPDELDAAALIVRDAAGADVDVDAEALRVAAPARDHVAALSAAARELDARGIEVADLAVRRPTLDDVFLQLTEEVPA